MSGDGSECIYHIVVLLFHCIGRFGSDSLLRCIANGAVLQHLKLTRRHETSSASISLFPSRALAHTQSSSWCATARGIGPTLDFARSRIHNLPPMFFQRQRDKSIDYRR